MTKMMTLVGSLLLGSLPFLVVFWVAVKPKPMLVLVTFARFVLYPYNSCVCVCVCVCIQARNVCHCDESDWLYARVCVRFVVLLAVVVGAAADCCAAALHGLQR